MKFYKNKTLSLGIEFSTHIKIFMYIFLTKFKLFILPPSVHLKSINTIIIGTIPQLY